MKYLFLLALAGSSFIASAQGELPVNMYTGTPNISIPLGSIACRDLSDNLYLAYDARGVRVLQGSGYYGLGWSLSNSTITRQVRGLPDDFTGTSGSDPATPHNSWNDPRRGWLYNYSTGSPMASEIGSFSNSSDLSASTYDESTDYSKLNSYGYVYDTEPDVFNVSFGGYSGQLVFDNNNPVGIHLVPYADIKIEVLQTGSGKTITGFKITTNNGNVYTFDQVVNEQRATQNSYGTIDQFRPEYQRRDFVLYDGNTYYSWNNNVKVAIWVSYTTEWKLSSVVSPNGATLSYDYEQLPQTTGSSTMSIAIYNGTGYTAGNDGCNDMRKVTDLRLSGISTNTGAYVDLTYNFYNSKLKKVVWGDNRNASSYAKEYDLTYDSVMASGPSAYYRYYLQTIQEISGCDHNPPYQFSYINRGKDLPPPSGSSMYGSNAVDFWGYYNGAIKNADLIPTMYYYPQLPGREQFRLYPISGYSGTTYTMSGSNRLPSATAMQTGTLNNIQYPWGGSTTIQYEPHQYHDAKTNTDYIGGGLRVKAVVYFDGVSRNSLITKNYVYTDSASGASSGRLIWRPQFVVPTYKYRELVDPTKVHVYSGNPWNYLYVRTDTDLSPQETTQGSAVGYKEVKVARPGSDSGTGSGSVRYRFLMPATYGDTTSGSWTSTLNKFARDSSRPMGAVTSGGTWMFPFAPNTNYDHERGLEWKKTEFDQSGNLVRLTNTTYQYQYKNGSSAYTIYGLKMEHEPNADSLKVTSGVANYSITPEMVYFFGKYQWLTDLNVVVQSQKVTTFDAASTSHKLANLTEYTYGSSAHRLLTQLKTTSADGTITISKLKYPLDYGTVPSGADDASTMIGNLQTSFRNGTVIEQYTTVQKPGGSAKVTGGTVTQFSSFSTSHILPRYQYSLNLASPLSSITESYIDGTTKTFKKDTNYELMQTLLSYDLYDNPTSAIGQDQINKTTGWGFSGSVPVVTVRNAIPGQFAFSDFETTTGNEFDLSIGTGYSTGQVITGTGRTSATGVHPVMILSKTIQKASSNYIFSFWFKKNEGVGASITISVKNTSLSTTYFTNTTTYNPSTANFQYYELNVPIDPALTSSFVIVMQGNGFGTGITSGPDLLPMVDDVAFYPAGADLSSFTYRWPYGVNATTVANRTSETVFDNLGRSKYKLDEFKNILQKTSYDFVSDLANPSFTPIYTIHVGATTFTASCNSCSCMTGVTYEWNTGSGYTTGTRVQSLTFSSAGTYTVTLRISHPIAGTKTYSHLITVIN